MGSSIDNVRSQSKMVQARRALQIVETRLKKLSRFRHHPDEYLSRSGGSAGEGNFSKPIVLAHFCASFALVSLKLTQAQIEDGRRTMTERVGRVTMIVLDSVGCGDAPDASRLRR